MKTTNSKLPSAREWLIQNNYPEIARKINEIMAEWKYRGVKTRRNWWHILAGGHNGKARTVYGYKFPVLLAAQKRFGIQITENAIHKKRREIAPHVIDQNRWEQYN